MGRFSESTPFQFSDFVLRFRENSKRLVLDISNKNPAFNFSGVLLFVGLGCSLKWWYNDQLLTALLKYNLPALSEPQQKISRETGEYVIAEQVDRVLKKKNVDLISVINRVNRRNQGIKYIGQVEPGEGSLQRNQVDISGGLVEQIDLYGNSVVVKLKAPWEKDAYHRFVGLFSEKLTDFAENEQNQSNEGEGLEKYTFFSPLLPVNWFKLSARGLCMDQQDGIVTHSFKWSKGNKLFPNHLSFSFVDKSPLTSDDFSSAGMMRSSLVKGDLSTTLSGDSLDEILSQEKESKEKKLGEAVALHPLDVSHRTDAKKMHNESNQKSLNVDEISSHGNHQMRHGVVQLDDHPNHPIRATSSRIINNNLPFRNETSLERFASTLHLDALHPRDVSLCDASKGCKEDAKRDAKHRKEDAQPQKMTPHGTFNHDEATVTNIEEQRNFVLQNDKTSTMIGKLSYPVELTAAMTGWQLPVETLLLNSYLDEIPYKIESTFLPLHSIRDKGIGSLEKEFLLKNKNIFGSYADKIHERNADIHLQNNPIKNIGSLTLLQMQRAEIAKATQALDLTFSQKEPNDGDSMKKFAMQQIINEIDERDANSNRKVNLVKETSLGVDGEIDEMMNSCASPLHPSLHLRCTASQYESSESKNASSNASSLTDSLSMKDAFDSLHAASLHQRCTDALDEIVSKNAPPVDPFTVTAQNMPGVSNFHHDGCINGIDESSESSIPLMTSIAEKGCEEMQIQRRDANSKKRCKEEASSELQQIKAPVFDEAVSTKKPLKREKERSLKEFQLMHMEKELKEELEDLVDSLAPHLTNRVFPFESDSNASRERILHHSTPLEENSFGKGGTDNLPESEKGANKERVTESSSTTLNTDIPEKSNSSYLHRVDDMDKSQREGLKRKGLKKAKPIHDHQPGVDEESSQSSQVNDEKTPFKRKNRNRSDASKGFDRKEDAKRNLIDPLDLMDNLGITFNNLNLLHANVDQTLHLRGINKIDQKITFADKKPRRMSGYVYPDMESKSLESTLRQWIGVRFGSGSDALLCDASSISLMTSSDANRNFISKKREDTWKGSKKSSLNLNRDGVNNLTLCGLDVKLRKVLDQVCLFGLEIPITFTGEKGFHQIPARDEIYVDSFTVKEFPAQKMTPHSTFDHDALHGKVDESSESSIPLMTSMGKKGDMNFIDDQDAWSESTNGDASPFERISSSKSSKSKESELPDNAIIEANGADKGVHRKYNRRLDYSLASFPGFTDPSYFLSGDRVSKPGTSSLSASLAPKHVNQQSQRNSESFPDWSLRKTAYEGLVLQRDRLTKDLQLDSANEMYACSNWATTVLGPNNPLTDRQSHFFGQRHLSTIDGERFQRDYLRHLAQETLAQSIPKGFAEKSTPVERVKILSLSKRVNSLPLKKRKYAYLLGKADQWPLVFQEQLRTALEDPKKYPPLTPEQVKDYGPGRIKVSAPLTMTRFPAKRPLGRSLTSLDQAPLDRGGYMKDVASLFTVDPLDQRVSAASFEESTSERGDLTGDYAPSTVDVELSEQENGSKRKAWNDSFLFGQSRGPDWHKYQLSLTFDEKMVMSGEEIIICDSSSSAMQGDVKHRRDANINFISKERCKEINSQAAESFDSFNSFDSFDSFDSKGGMQRDSSKLVYHYPLGTEVLLAEHNYSSRPSSTSLMTGKSKELHLPMSSASKKGNQEVKLFSKNAVDTSLTREEPLTANSWGVITQWVFLLALLLWVEQMLLEGVLPALSALEGLLPGATAMKSTERSRLLRVIGKNANSTLPNAPKFQHIAGVDGLLGELAELVLFLRGHFQWNRQISRGLLLTGPPGTGKTFLVRALAGEAKVPVLILSAGALVASKTNSSKPSWSIRHAFRRARQLAPCILFIDEIDALGQSRGGVVADINEIVANIDSNLLTQQKMQPPHSIKAIHSIDQRSNDHQSILQGKGSGSKDVKSNVFVNAISSETGAGNSTLKSNGHKNDKFGPLTQLLISMDGVSSLSGVLVVGATNRPESLDPALTRPGRFERIIKMEKPGEERRVEILKLYSRNLGIHKQIPWSYLANRTVGLTAADLAVAMNYSSLKAIAQESVHTVESIEYGLDSIARFRNSSKSSMRADLFASSVEQLADPTPESIQNREKEVDRKSKQFQRLADMVYYQAGKVVIQTLLPLHPPVALIKIDLSGITTATSADAHIPLDNTFSTHWRSSLESRIVGLYGGKAASLLVNSRFAYEQMTICDSPPMMESHTAFQSDLGTREIQAATTLASVMVNQWAFYFSEEKEFITDGVKSLKEQTKENEYNSNGLTPMAPYSFCQPTFWEQRHQLPKNSSPITSQVGVPRLIHLLHLSTAQRDRFYPGWFRVYLPDMEASQFMRNTADHFFSEIFGLQNLSNSSLAKSGDDTDVDWFASSSHKNHGETSDSPQSKTDFWKKRTPFLRNTDAADAALEKKSTLPVDENQSSSSSTSLDHRGAPSRSARPMKTSCTKNQVLGKLVMSVMSTRSLKPVDDEESSQKIRQGEGEGAIFDDMSDERGTLFASSLRCDASRCKVDENPLDGIHPKDVKHQESVKEYPAQEMHRVADFDHDASNELHGKIDESSEYIAKKGYEEMQIESSFLRRDANRNFISKERCKEDPARGLHSMQTPLSLQKQTFAVDHNDFSAMKKELIFHALVSNSFAKAFLLVDKNRQLVDYFADYLMRFQILRQDQILHLFSTLLLNCEKNVDLTVD